MKYTISQVSPEPQWAGDGDTDNGCFADLPDEVLEMADAGKTGEITVGGVTYRIDERD